MRRMDRYKDEQTQTEKNISQGKEIQSKRSFH